MRDGKWFARRLTVAVTLAFAVPPLLGLPFLVFVVGFVPPDVLTHMLRATLLPVYVMSTLVLAVVYFRWFLRPVRAFADQRTYTEPPVARMRAFIWHFWGVFLARHFIGAVIVLYAAKTSLGLDPTANDWVRVIALAFMLSALAGFPVFVYVMDLFAETFGSHSLREPILTVRSRILLIAIGVPVLLNTAVLQFLISRLGGLTLELVLLWMGVTAVAVVSAYTLLGSLRRSISELRSISQQREEATEATVGELRIRALDELGVMTCEYRDLLTDLTRQASLLDTRNRILAAANPQPDTKESFNALVKLVGETLGSQRAVLVVRDDAEDRTHVLARFGVSSSEQISLSPAVRKALGSSEVAEIPGGTASPDFADAAHVVVVPCLSASDEDEDEAVGFLAAVDQPPSLTQLSLIERVRVDLTAACRGLRVADEKASLEEMLLQAQRMEVVGRLAAGVAHDFNNILTVVVTAAGILDLEAEESTPNRAEIKESVELITNSVARATALTRQLLALSQQRLGTIEAIDVGQLVEGLDAFLRGFLPDNVTYESVLAPDADCVEANRGHLEQVITNLVVNARDAMEQDGGVLRIETGKGPDGTWIAVSDSGCGMGPEVRAHIFEPFFTTKRGDRGTGLGLATVYGIVKNLGGDLRVNSAPGQGTTMTLLLPTVSLPLDSIVASPAQASAAKRGRCIMLVEDDDGIRNIVARMLRRVGYHVVVAATGEEALAMIEEEQTAVDLLLTDLVMPGIKGTEVASKMEKLRPDARVVLMTGYAEPEVLEEAERPNRAFLSKPFATEELLALIALLLAEPCAQTCSQPEVR